MADESPQVFSVPGMSCQHCVDAITKSVEAVDGVSHVDIDLDAKSVSVVGGSAAKTVEAIAAAGYQVT